MRQRLLVGFCAFAVLALVAIEVPFGLSLAANARSTALSEVQNDGASLGLLVGSALEGGRTAQARSLIDRFAQSDNALVVVAANGKAELSAGHRAVEELADPSTKAIMSAAARGKVSGEEGGNDPDDDYIYAALPIAQATGTVNPAQSRTFDLTLLVAETAGPLHSRIADDWIKLSVFGAVLLAVALVIGALIARSIARPLAGVEAAVSGFGAGNLTTRAPANRGPTELRTLAETVNEMAARIEELLNVQRAFVADASHQLRTPMTALRLRLENLELGLGDDARGELGLVIAEADRLSRVVNGLLALARSEGVRAPREAVDIVAALVDRVDAWTALAEERNVRLEYRSASQAIAAEPLSGLACSGTLEQVIDNLLANAVDATPPGGTVSLGAERVGDNIEIHIVDSGPGMSAESRERAFERFWREPGSAQEGSGLGLAIVAQLVRASGGATWLDVAKSGGIDAVVQLESSPPGG